MSDSVVLCHKFLVLILIIFHAEALRHSPWKSYPGRYCFWKHSEGTNYELVLRDNFTLSRQYASITTFYQLEGFDNVPGRFCVKFSVNRFEDYDFVLIINSIKYPIQTAEVRSRCVDYNTFTPFKVSFSVTCNVFHRLSFNNLEITVIRVKLEDPTTTTPFPTPLPTVNGSGTSNVGDIQYVGVVVGAICIALFTLFSCLTIISARRSNQRSTIRTTLPSASCQDEDDNRPDVVADNAPPSYDAVMACPDLYPPTPQDTPHGTPETTPHLSLHRRALLNQHMGSLPGSASGTPQLNRQSFTPTIASDEWDELPEYPPPPYPGLANGDVSTPIPEDVMDNGTEVENTPGIIPGIENPGVSQPGSDSSRASSPNQDSSSPATGDQENPWVLNNIGNSHLRDRDNSYPSRDNTEQYPMRARTPSDDSTHSNRDTDSQGELTSRSNSPVIDTTSESAQGRSPKPMVESGALGVRVAVV